MSRHSSLKEPSVRFSKRQEGQAKRSRRKRILAAEKDKAARAAAAALRMDVGEYLKQRLLAWQAMHIPIHQRHANTYGNYGWR